MNSKVRLRDEGPWWPAPVDRIGEEISLDSDPLSRRPVDSTGQPTDAPAGGEQLPDLELLTRVRTGWTEEYDPVYEWRVRAAVPALMWVRRYEVTEEQTLVRAKTSMLDLEGTRVFEDSYVRADGQLWIVTNVAQQPGKLDLELASADFSD